jgi:hypothetical protein
MINPDSDFDHGAGHPQWPVSLGNNAEAAESQGA